MTAVVIYATVGLVVVDDLAVDDDYLHTYFF